MIQAKQTEREKQMEVSKLRAVLDLHDISLSGSAAVPEPVPAPAKRGLSVVR